MDVRPATAADLAAVTAIYNHYVLTSIATFDLEPFTADQRRGWFEQFATSGPHRLLVGADNGAVVGYASSGPFRAKPGYGQSVETTVYLQPGYSGQGHGRALYTALFAQLAGQPLHRAFAAIALPNDASIGLHRALGFTSVGTFTEAGYKHGRHIDVHWLQRPLP